MSIFSEHLPTTCSMMGDDGRDWRFHLLLGHFMIGLGRHEMHNLPLSSVIRYLKKPYHSLKMQVRGSKRLNVSSSSVLYRAPLPISRRLHLYRSLLYGAIVSLSFFMMLVFMTYK